MDSRTTEEKVKGLRAIRKIKDRLVILLKNDSRRFYLTITIALISILLLTSFFTTWNSTKKVNFITFIEENKEAEVSAYYSTIKDGFIPNYSIQYLEDLTIEIQETMNSIYPNIISPEIASMMTVEFYTNEISSTDFSHSELRTTTAENLPLLNRSLISGRMPENSNEVLYLQEHNESSYNLYDQVFFRNLRIPNSFAQNFTIVGILGPLEEWFEANGYSTLLIHWQEHIHEYRYVFPVQEVFYTTAANFFPAINSFSEIDLGRAVIVDFVYNYSELKVQNLPYYLSEHQALLQTNSQFPSESAEEFTLCKDLYITLQNFNYFWIYETTKSFLMLAPVFYLFFFVASELSTGEQVKFKNIIYKMKLQGLSNNTIRVLLFLKVLLIHFLAIFFGLIFGMLITFAMVKIMSIEVTFQIFIKFLLEPLYLTLLGLTVFVLVTNILLSENYLLRKTSVMISQPKKQKESKKKKKRVWLTVNEQICLLIGIGILFPGGLSVLVYPLESMVYTSITYTVKNIISIVSWGFVIIGSLVVIIGVFNIIARIIIAQIVEVGERKWSKEKNRLSYILKNIVTNKANYKRLIIVALIVNVGVLPGIILTPSINKQIELERDLSTGCADLLIENWDNTTLPQQKIEAITGVQQTTVVTLVSVYYEHILSSGGSTIYSVAIVAIHNCEEFNQVIDWKRLGRVRYSKKDIEDLSKNLTYLMDKKCAKENNFDDPEIILHNTFYGEKTENLDLEYINSFDSFPLLPLLLEESTSIYNQYITFRLVTSQQTINLLEVASNSSSATFSDYLLLKTATESNLTVIKNEIKDLYRWTSIITPTAEESGLHNVTNTFTSAFSIVCSVIFTLIVFFYGYTIASIIYLQRLRIIETEFRLGINKSQIWQGMLLEVLVTTVIPVVLSTLFSILYSLLLKQMIPIQQNYHKFALWMPWWVLLLTTIISECLIVGGNSASLIPLVKKYRPVKVE